MTRLLAVLLAAAVLFFLGLCIFISVDGPTQYCESEYLKKDLEYVGDMNVCMATVACNFQREAVREYREAVGRIDICAEKAKLEAIHEPDPSHPWTKP